MEQKSNKQKDLTSVISLIFKTISFIAFKILRINITITNIDLMKQKTNVRQSYVNKLLWTERNYIDIFRRIIETRLLIKRSLIQVLLRKKIVLNRLQSIVRKNELLK